MANTIDTGASSSALSLLQNASQGGSASGMFSAINSGSNGASQISPLFAAINGGNSNPSSVQQITRDQQIKNQKSTIFTNIGKAINAVATGQMQPTTDWLKVAGYFSAQGMPFIVSMDNKGQPLITDQTQMDLSKYSNTQQNTMIQALQQLQNLGPKLTANADHQGLQNTWDSVPVKLTQDIAGNRVPDTAWEQQAQNLYYQNIPFTYNMDEKGTISIQDQRFDTFFDKPYQVQAPLHQAVKVVQDAMKVDTEYTNMLSQIDQTKAYNAAHTDQQTVPEMPTELYNKWVGYQKDPWVQDALAYKAMGVPFYLDADTTQTDISAFYVQKTQKTVVTKSDGTQVTNTTLAAVYNNGTDSNGLPDTTTNATSPEPGTKIPDRVNTGAATDAAGQPLTIAVVTAPHYVQKNEQTVWTNSDGTTTSEQATATVNKNGVDSLGLPDNTTDATAPNPGTSIPDRVSTTAMTDANGQPLTISLQTPPHYVLKSQQTVTTLSDGSTTTSASSAIVNGNGFDSLGLPDTTTNAASPAPGTTIPDRVNTAAVTDANGQPLSITVLDAATGQPLLDGNGNPAFSSNGPVSYTVTDQNNLTISDANGNLLYDSAAAGTAVNLSISDSLGNTTTTDGTPASKDVFQRSTAHTTWDAAASAYTTVNSTTGFDPATGNATGDSSTSVTTVSYSNETASAAFRQAHPDALIDPGGPLLDNSGNPVFSSNAAVSINVTDPNNVTITDTNGNTLYDSAGTAVNVSVSDSLGHSWTTDGTPTAKEIFSKSSTSTTWDGAAGAYNATQTTTGFDVTTGNSTSDTRTGVTTVTYQNVAATSAFTQANPAVNVDPGGQPVLDANGNPILSTTNPVTINVTDQNNLTVNDANGNPLYTSAGTPVNVSVTDSLGHAYTTDGTPTTKDISAKTSTQLAWDSSAQAYNGTTTTTGFDIATGGTKTDTSTSVTTVSYQNIDLPSPDAFRRTFPDVKIDHTYSPHIMAKPLTALESPAWVKTDPYSSADLKIGTDQWMQDAAKFMKAGSPFMLDFDQTGKLITKELTPTNIVAYNNPPSYLPSYSSRGSTASYQYSGATQVLSVIA